MRIPVTTVLIVTHYFAHHGGGIERVASELAKAYSKRHALNVIWVASNCDAAPTETRNLHMLPMSSWNGIERLCGLPYPLWSPIALPRLWRAVGLSDVVHLHDYIYFGNLLTSLLAAIRRKPVLITQHIGLIPYENKIMRGVLSLLNRALGAFVLRRANQAIFVSEAVQSYFCGITAFREQPKLIPNGLDTDIFHELSNAQRDAMRATLEMPTGRIVLLFAGRFVEKKGLGVLRELCHEFADCHWLLVGEGSIDPNSWDLPNVRVFQKLPQISLARLYQTADLLILPSKGEGFPLVVQEAMACGTPAMVGVETATALPNLTGLIFSADAEGESAVSAWKTALRAILDNRTELFNLRTRVASHAKREWSWQNCATAYVTEMEHILVSKVH